MCVCFFSFFLCSYVFILFLFLFFCVCVVGPKEICSGVVEPNVSVRNVDLFTDLETVAGKESSINKRTGKI